MPSKQFLSDMVQVLGNAPELWPPLQLLENWVTTHLRLKACRGMPQHSKLFLGTVGACLAAP